jgi:PHD/YefM family antitoxin component YafN of YafNO toxin-antitoxin module
MVFTFMKSKDFKQSLSRIKKAAMTAPVFITEYGKPAFVMLNIEEYEEILSGVELPRRVAELEVILSPPFAIEGTSPGSQGS